VNRSRLRISLLAPLLAVLALLLGLAGSASAAFNAAATDPHYGNFLLHTEAPARMPLAIADSSREIGARQVETQIIEEAACSAPAYGL
jgi:hypothetical protein